MWNNSIEETIKFTSQNGEYLKHNNYSIDPDQVFLILMMGPRRCGKTSLLTAIQDCIETSIAGTPIRFTYRGDDSSEDVELFNKQRKNLIAFAQEPKNESREGKGNSGIVATDEVRIFDFVMYHYKSPKELYMVRFVDIPGEAFITNPDAVNKVVARSNMILVAIDTPALMSGDASKSNNCNEIRTISDYLSNHLSNSSENTSENDILPRLISFVPLKCERYHKMDKFSDNNSNMTKVADEVYKQYGNAIKNLCMNDNLAVAITPVLTVGGVIFSSYETGKTDGKGLPISNYIVDASNPGYNPLYCEQPFLYFIVFFSNYLEKVRINYNVFDWLKTGFMKVFKSKILEEKNRQLFNGIQKLSPKLKNESDGIGYRVIHDIHEYLSVK